MKSDTFRIFSHPNLPRNPHWEADGKMCLVQRPADDREVEIAAGCDDAGDGAQAVVPQMWPTHIRRQSANAFCQS
jgi:hypothetical protein